MNIKKQIFIQFILLVFFILPLSVSAEHLNDNIDNTFKKGDIVNLISPSVMQLGQHVVGKITLAGVDIDLRTLKFRPVFGTTSEIKIDEYIIGSGFFVDSRGYIATNAHVVSKNSVKDKILKDSISSEFTLKMLQYSKKDIAKIQSYDFSKIEEFKNRIYNYLMKNSQFDLSYTVSAINPITKSSDINTIIDNGIPVKIIYSNNNFFSDVNDLNDIAIVKINDDRFSTVPVLLSDNATTGAEVYFLGYSSINQMELGSIKPTIISGSIVNKKSTSNGFILQSDVKIPDELSGGPVVDKYGNVIGVAGSVLQKTDYKNSTVSIIPSEALINYLDDLKIENKEGTYGEIFRGAIKQEKQLHCKEAIIEFNSLKNLLVFDNASKYTAGYIDRCRELISTGNSIDTKWQIFLERLKNISIVVWGMVLAGVIIIAISTILIFLLKKYIDKKKEELKILENNSLGDNTVDITSGVVKSKNKESNGIVNQSINPELVRYVRDAKNSNIDDVIIKKELKSAGWNNNEIKEVFEYVD